MVTLLYRLPLSRVRIQGTLTTVDDTILGSSIVRDATATIGVMAAPGTALSLDLEAGILRDSEASFKLTEDGRLTESSRSQTGQGAVALTGIVGIASTIIGGALRLTTPIAAYRPAVAAAEPEAVTPRTAKQKSGAVEARYLLDRSGDANARTRAMKTLADLRSAQQGALARLAKAGPKGTAAMGRELARLSAAISLAESDVDRETQKFEAWRATTISSSSVALIHDITLDELRASDATIVHDKLHLPKPPATNPKQAQAQIKVRDAWDQLGCAVLVKNDPAEVEPKTPVVGELSDDNLYVRHPRPVILQFYERADESGVATLVREEPVLVVDAMCPLEWINVESGLFGKDTRGVTFTAEGIPTGYDYGKTSEAAAAIGALGGIPAGLTTGLENVSKASGFIQTIRSAGAEAVLQDTKRKVDTRTQQLSLEGLERTSKDFAELEWLKQQASVVEQRAKAFPAAPAAPDPLDEEIAQLRRQAQLNILRRLVDQAG